MKRPRSHAHHEGREPALWVDSLARLMDSRFRLPGTSIRFGLDPIIGLLPVVGDSATLLVGTAMIAEAARLRLGARVMIRMMWNLVVDWAIGLVPGIDLVLDTAFKAHTKNAELLQRSGGHASKPRPASNHAGVDPKLEHEPRASVPGPHVRGY